MKHIRWICLLTAFALLLTGCSLSSQLSDASPQGEITRLLSTLRRPAAMTSFPDIPYVRPEVEVVNRLLGDAATLAQAGQDADGLLSALDAALDAYDNFYTMQTIADIRADADQTDTYYSAERTYCEIQSAQVEQTLEAMLQACARSDLRTTLEKEGRFAAHELDYYEDSNDYDDTFVSLYQQEAELVSRYRALLSDPEVLLDGAQVNLNDYLSRFDLTQEEYDAAYLAYLQQVNDEAAEIYCALVRLRKQIATLSGYDSYESFQYDYYGRDYKPMDMAMVLSDIREQMGPLRTELLETGAYDELAYPAMSEQQLLRTLSTAMQSLGADAAEAWQFMTDYSLYDVRVSMTKASTSYTAYLTTYDAPYLFVNTYGDVEDLSSISHEFGHFLAAYVQDDSSASLDLDEVYSQAMEYMTLPRLKGVLSDDRYTAFSRIMELSMLDTYTQQAAYAAFEEAVYDLPDEELNAQRLNSLFYECLDDFGCAEYGEEKTALWWTQLDHYYSAPFYIVSYVVSLDAAAQIGAAGEGEDWTTYRTLLDNIRQPYLRALSSANLKSIFSEGRIAEAEATLRAALSD